jgi:energy-coupling factor transporter ATP-binding protein EcfA2
MYLKSFLIEDIKCFGHVELDFLHSDEKVKRWSVILGENGTGKSTLLQAIAMALMGPDPANRLRRPDGWVRTGCRTGKLIAEILPGQSDQLTGGGKPRTKTPYKAPYAVTGTMEVDIGGVIYDRPTIVFDGTRTQLNALKRGPLSERSAGWFASGYGPFRRLRGGSVDATRLMYPGQKEARFVTLFREDAALGDLDEWLKNLDHRSKENSDAGNRARQVRDVVGAVTGHLLPEGVRLARIGPDGVFFDTPYSRETLMPELSDGYQAMLALATDLLRRLDETFERVEDWINADGQIIAEGVVLIDELDAHLHPVWQREIGFWLKERFPNMQFIVATHSPFIPQAADADAIFVLRQQTPEGDRVAAYRDQPSVLGWRVEQILHALFNLAETRDPETERKMRRYAELQARIAAGSLWDRAELNGLIAWLDAHLSPPGDTLEEMRKYRDIQRQVEAFLQSRQESSSDA